MNLIIGLVLIITGAVLVFVANFMTFAIVEEINDRSSSDQQISMFFIQLKMGEIFRRHRELFPNSKKRRRSTIIGIAGLAMVVSGALVALSSISPATAASVIF